jgi:hypothetical protein
MKTDQVKKFIVDRFEEPINEVQEAFYAYEEAYDENCKVLQFGDCDLLDKTRNDLQQKISNLKALLPTIQGGA